MKSSHELTTRQQLIKYIQAYKPPSLVVKQLKEAVIPKYDLYNQYPYQWNIAWLKNSELPYLITLIELLEEHEGLCMKSTRSQHPT